VRPERVEVVLSSDRRREHAPELRALLVAEMMAGGAVSALSRREGDALEPHPFPCIDPKQEAKCLDREQSTMHHQRTGTEPRMPRPSWRARGTGSMEYRTKEEQVADYLREAILSGRLARGARLKQAEIAEQLQISITPVREALRLLEAEGYIDSRSYKGATVVPFDIAASEEILNLRILLEGQLVRHAVQRATTADLEEVRHLAEDFAAAVAQGDSTVARGANYRFHRRLYDTAGMPQTLHFVQILWARYPFDIINRLDGRAARAAQEHEELLRCVIEGDVAGAILSLRRHIEAGWGELNARLTVKDADRPALSTPRNDIIEGSAP
jgi:DNA-binding GntR family transcriptional regulator